MTEEELIKAQSDLIAAQQKFISAIAFFDGNDPGQFNFQEKVLQEPKKITLSEYVQTFLESRECTTKKSTYQTYIHSLKKHILPVLGDMELCKIDNLCLQRFADEKLKNLSRKTVHELVALVKNILNDACINEIIEPRKFTIKYPKDEKTDYETLPEKDFKKLEEYLLSQKKPHDIGELIMLETGIRIGEMCGLKWQDVDIDNRTIKIKRTVQRIYKTESKTSELNIGNTKTSAGERMVPVSRHINEYLRGCKQNADIYVASGKETPTEPRTHRQYHSNLLKKLDIKYITPHGLRHTFATRAIQKGVDPKTVSAILGHSNSNITLNIYTTVTEDMLRQGIEKMNNTSVLLSECGQKIKLEEY